VSSLGIGLAGMPKVWPHSPQNLNCAGLGALHFGQMLSILAPQFPQNFKLSGFSNWHFGHFIFSS
jgi:hypothetical protein